MTVEAEAVVLAGINPEVSVAVLAAANPEASAVVLAAEAVANAMIAVMIAIGGNSRKYFIM